MAMGGVIATIATVPKASRKIFSPTAAQAPIEKGSRNVAVMGPLATAPESKAMAVNSLGTKKLKMSAMA